MEPAGVYFGRLGLFVRINSGWYGLHMTARFFDFPPFQYFLLVFFFSFLGCALKAAWEALNILCPDKNDDSDAEQEK